MNPPGREPAGSPAESNAGSAPSSHSSHSSSSMGQAASSAGDPQQYAWEFLEWFQAHKIKTGLLNFFVLYASLPFLIRLFPPLLQKFVYLNFLSYPFWVDYQKPEVYLNHTRNFYLTSEPGINIGIWLQRATSHRVLFTKVMSDNDFHVLAVDYRGYADSTGHPSENGFTTDILCVYNWVKARSGNSTVIFWGHSLGTGIATNTAKKLQEIDGVIVDAIVLEAPYTNIRDAAANIPFTKIYRKFPGFKYFVLDTMARADMYFENDKNVKILSSPLLILHSEDDKVIPVQLGKKVFEIAHNASEKKDHVQFIPFPASMGLGHDYIAANPELASILKNFLKSVK
nr:protein ABHD12B [Anolis sagrei ordinatus]